MNQTSMSQDFKIPDVMGKAGEQAMSSGGEKEFESTNLQIKNVNFPQ